MMFFFIQNSTSAPIKAKALLNRALAMLGLVLFQMALLTPAQAQIQVYTVQEFAFGAFALGLNGGTVTLDHEGTRTASGDIILVNQAPYHPLIFEIEAPLGSMIHIQNGPEAVLTGSNGGELRLNLGMSSTGSPFSTTVSPPDRTTVTIGASLTMEGMAETPSGSYQGSISVTFIQE